MLDGAPHRRERGLLLPPLHGARLQAYGSLIQDLALRRAAAWRPGSPFRRHAFMQALSLEVIIKAVFGVRDEERGQQLAGAASLQVGRGHPGHPCAPDLHARPERRRADDL